MGTLVLLLAAAVAVTPLYLLRLTISGVPIYLPEWFILAGAGWWVGLILTRRTRLVWPPAALILPIGLLIVGTAISSVLAGSASLGPLKSWVLVPALFSFLAYQVLTTAPPTRRHFALSLLASSSLVSLYGLFQVASRGGRLESFFNSPNAAAMWLVPIFFILLSRFRQKPFAIGLVLIFISVFLTKSFGGIIALLSGLLAVWLVSRAQAPAQKTIAAVLPIGGLILFAYFSLTNSLSQLLANLFGERLGGRLQIWSIARFAVTDNWLWGIGSNQFSAYYFGRVGSFFSTPIEWNVPQPHNLYLATWLAGGLFGFIGFFWLLAALFYQQVKTYQPALFGALAAIVVHGLVDTPYWKNDLSIIFFLIVALTFTGATVSESTTK